MSYNENLPGSKTSGMNKAEKFNREAVTETFSLVFFSDDKIILDRHQEIPQGTEAMKEVKRKFD